MNAVIKRHPADVLVTIPYRAGHAWESRGLVHVIAALKTQTVPPAVIHVAEAGERTVQTTCRTLGVTYSFHPTEKFDANRLRNAGPHAYTSHEWLLWLDQDIVMHPNAVEFYLEYLTAQYMRSDPRHTIITSRRTHLADDKAVKQFKQREILLEQAFENLYRVPWEHAPGNNIMTHRSTYNYVGDWDERLRNWGHEDLDYVLCAQEDQVQLVQFAVPGGLCGHLQHEANTRRTAAAFKENMDMFHRKHGDEAAKLSEKEPEKVGQAELCAVPRLRQRYTDKQEDVIRACIAGEQLDAALFVVFKLIDMAIDEKTMCQDMAEDAVARAISLGLRIGLQKGLRPVVEKIKTVKKIMPTLDVNLEVLEKWVAM